MDLFTSHRLTIETSMKFLLNGFLIGAAQFSRTTLPCNTGNDDTENVEFGIKGFRHNGVRKRSEITPFRGEFKYLQLI